ncbi:MAG: SPFH domain-containing protein [Verrucomicrobiota bacterium]|nr:SPFH domain-containing protein [Verrucomicrobiota bacterium]
MNNTEKHSSNTGGKALLNALSFTFFALRMLIISLFFLFIFGGSFFVREYEQAMILRFGQLSGKKGKHLIESGKWCWAWPYPIDKVVKIPSKRSIKISTEQFWFKEDSNQIIAPEDKGAALRDSPLVPGVGGYLVTADANIIHAQWSAVIQISDPIKYYLEAAKPKLIIKKHLENAVLTITSGWDVDEALYKNSNDYRLAVEKKLFKKISTSNLGLSLKNVYLTLKTPPKSAITAFRKVIEAEQQMHRKISEAEAYAYRKMNEADGEKAQILSEARIYKKRITSNAQAEAEYFSKIEEEYDKNPETTLIALYNDTIAEVMDKVEQKFIIYAPSSDEQYQEIRLQITPKKNKKE